MPSYLVQVAYTSEALSRFISKPHDRTETVRKAVEKLGGKLGPLYLCFGDYDVVGIYDMPDNVSAAAFAFAISAGGSCKAVKTTPLMSTSDAVTAMKKARSSGYKPVGK
jgi:uncharacterized protein with GYD domain